MEFVYRFILGGLIVSLFALIGDVLRPRSFAGLFGAAPLVALATLALYRAEYTAQVALYAQAIEKATNSSVSGILLVI